MSFVLWAKRNRMFTMLLSWNTHTQLLWWATKSGDILTAHTTRTNTTSIQISLWKLWFFGLFVRHHHHYQQNELRFFFLRPLVLLRLVCKQVNFISYPRTYTRTYVVALYQLSSQHYLYAFKPLLLRLNWCILSTDWLNCTCTACNLHFGFCGFSTASKCITCVYCVDACFSVKTFSQLF